jgi:hypothetical protein
MGGFLSLSQTPQMEFGNAKYASPRELRLP